MTARVLFLLPFLHKGGMQRAVSNISRALPADIEQHVAFFGTENPGFEYRAVLHDFGAMTSRLPGLPGSAATFAARLMALRRYVARHRIDTVVSFGELANVYSLASKHGAKTIISLRVDIDSELSHTGRGGRILKRLVGMLYPTANRAVSVSSDLAKQVASSFPRLAPKLSVINNLYHLDDIRRLAAEQIPASCRMLEGRRYLVTVGSLVFQKGHDLLLEAFARVAERQGLYLAIVGRGPKRDELIQQIRTLRLDDRVTLIDYDSNPFRIMARAHAFVLSSRYEGFPNVLVEAMACGCPVIAFDCPTGPREILGANENGILVPALDVPALGDAIESLFASDALLERYRRAAVSRAQAFGADVIAPQWARLLTA